MKFRHPIVLTAALLGTLGGAHAAGVPVFDGVLNTQTKLAWVKQAADMITQIKTLERQLDQAKATFKSMNGARDISNLLNNPALYDYLPPDLAAALRSNASGLPGADAIRKNLKLLGIEETGLDPSSPTAASFEARQTSNANIQVLNEQALHASDGRIKQFDAMVKSIDGAQDPMAIQALAVRVNAEQGRTANEQTRLATLASMAANADRQLDQQNREIVMKASQGPMPQGW